MKQRRSDEECKFIYNFLRKLKVPAYECRRMRHWTQNHINLYLSVRKLRTIKRTLSPIYKPEEKENV